MTFHKVLKCFLESKIRKICEFFCEIEWEYTIANIHITLISREKVVD